MLPDLLPLITAIYLCQDLTDADAYVYVRPIY